MSGRQDINVFGEAENQAKQRARAFAWICQENEVDLRQEVEPEVEQEAENESEAEV